MQELQPEIAKLQKQYGSDRQGMSQAMMALQKERGVNPLAGCLPILPQIPVFISLFHVLRRLAPGTPGPLRLADAAHPRRPRGRQALRRADLGLVQHERRQSRTAILAIAGATATSAIVAMVLIVIMCVTTFMTQKQICRRSGPVEGQAATVQKLMLYGMPLSLFVSGFLFPIGVLLYWFTNNLWTLGQQFFILARCRRPVPRPRPPRPSPTRARSPPSPAPSRSATGPAGPPRRSRRSMPPPRTPRTARARTAQRRTSRARTGTARRAPGAPANGGASNGTKQNGTAPNGSPPNGTSGATAAGPGRSQARSGQGRAPPKRKRR